MGLNGGVEIVQRERRREWERAQLQELERVPQNVCRPFALRIVQ